MQAIFITFIRWTIYWFTLIVCISNLKKGCFQHERIKLLYLYCLALVADAWLEHIKNTSHVYSDLYTCLQCAPGCAKCDSPTPCLAEYNWPFRWDHLDCEFTGLISRFFFLCPGSHCWPWRAHAWCSRWLWSATWHSTASWRCSRWPVPSSLPSRFSAVPSCTSR